MYFADFTKLKIDTTYNYLTKTIPLYLEFGESVSSVKQKIIEGLEKLNIEETTIPVLYDFTIAATRMEDMETQKIVDTILSIANIATPTTLQFLETGKGYKRERRLDVPDRLKPLHTSYGAIKRACNHEIKTPLINIKVSYDQIFYLFCDGREVDEVKGEDSDE